MKVKPFPKDIKPHQISQYVNQIHNLKSKAFEAWINYTSIITPLIPVFEQFMTRNTIGTFYSERFKK